MRITVLAENLNKAMGIVIKGVSGKSQLPVLSNVLIRATKSGLELISTDLEISFVCKVGAKIEDEGEILVPAKLFADLVSTLSLGSVELSTEKQVLKVSAEKNETELTGMAADEFPGIPRALGKGIEIDAGEFKDKMEKVMVAAARDNARPVLEGVLWVFEGVRGTIAATDGYRMGTDCFKDIKGVTKKEEEKVILPVRALRELIRALPEEGQSIGVELDREKQQVVFKVGNLEMISRLIGGDFPPFDQIIPKAYKTRVVFDRELLLSGVRRASIFAKGNANIVLLKISEEGLEVSAGSAEVGKNVSRMEVEFEGEAVEMAFNGRYLLEYLGSVTTDKVTLETEGDLKPGVFKIEGSEFLHIIMPIRQNT